ncbi:MAG: metallophosphoesterase [Clostridia bacterium]|nr:metallophosphoesterase [Clostridia bacterium]
MSLYAIADLHLSLGTDKPMDVFSGWDGYVDRLTENWRRLVSDEDTVVIAGDVSWGMSLETAKPDFAFLNALPGHKLILKGNHDYWWNTRRKMDAFFADNGFDTLRIVHNDAVAVEDRFAVCGSRGWFFDAEDEDRKVLLREAGRLRTSIRAAKKTGLRPIVFLHYPPVFRGEVCEDIWQVLLEEEIDTCYYGHVHAAGIRHAFCGEKDGVALRLISCDALAFCPLLVE